MEHPEHFVDPRCAITQYFPTSNCTIMFPSTAVGGTCDIIPILTAPNTPTHAFLEYILHNYIEWKGNAFECEACSRLAQ